MLAFSFVVCSHLTEYSLEVDACFMIIIRDITAGWPRDFLEQLHHEGISSVLQIYFEQNVFEIVTFF